MFKLVYLIPAILLVSACSSIPETIRNAPQADINLLQVQNDFLAHQSKTVRWGGTVIKVENMENESILHIMSYPLEYKGRPDLSAREEGRFIVKTKEFLDPAIYTKNSELSIFGSLVGESEHLIGQKKLKLPTIKLQELYLWPEYLRQSYYGYSGYSPYYGSYRYGGYRYRRSYYRSYGHCY